jgi:hypothetical protein
MVKPPLRTKSIGFKVSEEEYAQLETAAQADGRTLGEWCREVILRGGAGVRTGTAAHGSPPAQTRAHHLKAEQVLQQPDIHGPLGASRPRDEL